jgi:hypothetical protein
LCPPHLRLPSSCPPCLQVFDAEVHAAGPLTNEKLLGMLEGTPRAGLLSAMKAAKGDGKGDGKGGGASSSITIAEGFQMIITSDFSMHTFRNYLRGKLPLGNVAPVQVCTSLSQVAAVLRDPDDACPADNMRKSMAIMDDLADML